MAWNEKTLGGWPSRVAVLGLALAASCVSQEQYDEAVGQAKHFQTRVHELEAERQGLQGENRRLARQLEASQIEAAEAGYTEEIDQRIGHLDSIVAQLGRSPGEAEKFQVDGGYVYRLRDAVLFELGSAEVSPEGRNLLLEVARDILAEDPERIEVRGHTDDTGFKREATIARYPHGNLQLSADRAVQVAAILIRDGGVPAERLVAMGYGEHRPVVPNDSAANKQKNRRVDIFVSTDTDE